MKRVLFVFAMGMLLLMPVLGCADTSSNEMQVRKGLSAVPTISNFSAVSSSVPLGGTPQFDFVVSLNTQSIKMIGPDGSVIFDLPTAADGDTIIKPTDPKSTKGVYPANFKGAAYGEPSKIIAPATQIFTLTATNDFGTAKATCTIYMIKK